MNVTDPIIRMARLRLGHAAIVRADGEAISYARLHRLIDAAGHRILAAGLRPGDTAALDIAGPDEAVGIVLALALARLGVASAAPTIADALCHHRFGVASLLLDSSWLHDPATPVPPVPCHQDPDAVLRVFASSGTTGAPKHVPVTHRQYRARMEGYGFALDARPATRVIAAGLGITWGFSGLMRTLWAGGTVVLSNPARFAAAALAHRVSCLSASPIALAAILQGLPAGVRLTTLDLIEVSGAALSPALAADAAARLCPRIDVMIGASETGAVAAAPLRTSGMDQPGASGLVVPFVQARTVDEHGTPLPWGQEGALQYRGPGLATAYLDAPFPIDSEGWFTTTDHGVILPGGLLCLLGRTSDVINLGGVKTAPASIEAVVARFPGVSDCAVFPVPGPDGIDQVWAAVTGPQRLDLAALSAACALLGPLRPMAFLQPDSLPRNANGKVAKGELRALAVRRRSQI